MDDNEAAIQSKGQRKQKKTPAATVRVFFQGRCQNTLEDFQSLPVKKLMFLLLHSYTTDLRQRPAKKQIVGTATPAMASLSESEKDVDRVTIYHKYESKNLIQAWPLSDK